MRLGILFLICTWLIPAAYGDDAPVTPVNDVRILIDVSGSMKKNDPANLRTPALRLITQLLPDGTEAGVWTFGQYVNMLVPEGPVDQAWKDKAYKAAAQINSHGLYTNIEDVLERSTWDWKRPEDNANRSIIFLTDGVVDISKDKEQDEASRKRILDKTLDRLKKAGAVIHTIALSDQADKGFLQQLSVSTHGWFQEVQNADQLERVFLRMFEKSVPADTLPMDDNKVRVDNSVRELTMLIFREEGAEETHIILPDGKQFSWNDAPENVRWRHEKRYDLVTVEQPAAGEWKINAKLDPDNRAMIVTDLRVRASRFSNVMLAGDTKDYFVELLEDNKVITKGIFLDLVNITLDRSLDGVKQQSIAIADDGKGIDEERHDGKFSGRVETKGLSGDYQYDLLIDGGTFQRSSRQLVRIVDAPVAVTAQQVGEGEPAHYAVTLVPYPEIIDPESLKIDAQLSKAGEGSLAVDIPRVGPTEWRLDLNIKAGEQFQLALAVKAKKIDGSDIEADLGKFTLGKTAPGESLLQNKEPASTLKGETDLDKTPMEPLAKPEADHLPVAEPPAAHEAPAAEQEAKAPETSAEEGAAAEEAPAEEAPNWWLVIGKVLLLNGVLIGAGFFAYRKWFRKAPTEDEEASDKEGKEDD